MRPDIASALLLASMLATPAQAALSDYVRLEADGGDAVKPKQPVLASRDGRFIRFDTSETEIELELGVAVPFLKIPLKASVGPEHHADHRVTLNPAGLLVGATLLITSFLLVPLVLPAGGHHARKEDDASFGDGGRSDNGIEGDTGGEVSGAWAFTREADRLLTNYNLNPRSCPQKAVCLMGHHLTSSIPGVLDTLTRIDAVKRLLGTSGIVNAINSGTCEEAFPTCALSQQTMALLPRILGVW